MKKNFWKVILLLTISIIGFFVISGLILLTISLYVTNWDVMMMLTNRGLSLLYIGVIIAIIFCIGLFISIFIVK